MSEIKALEWQQMDWMAWHVADTYRIEPGTDERLYLRQRTLSGALQTIGVFDTLEAAKAAAQSDYEARIRSAIVERKAEPVAWMHPTAGWASASYDEIRPHCRNDGPMPVPLYSTPPVAPVGKAEPDYDAIKKRALIAADAEYACGPEETAFNRAINSAVEWGFMELAALSASPSPVDSRDAREVSTGVLNDMLLACAPDCRWTIASILKERGLNYRQRLDYMRAALSAALAAKEQQPSPLPPSPKPAAVSEGGEDE